MRWQRQQGLCVNVTVESQTNICFIMNVIIISITNVPIKVELPLRAWGTTEVWPPSHAFLNQHSFSKGKAQCLKKKEKSLFTRNITHYISQIGVWPS